MKKRKQGIAKCMKSEVEKHFQKCNLRAHFERQARLSHF
jgi:hypothetical protein